MKTILLILLVAVAASCNKGVDKDKKNTVSNDVIDSKLAENNFNDYHTVPEMISLDAIGGSLERSWELQEKYAFTTKRDDRQYSWQYFDSLYQTIPGKNSFITQSFGYAILIKKSLLDEYTPEAEEKIKFYVAALVKTGYHGYGALYFSLARLAQNPANKLFVAAQLNEIVRYAASDEKAKALLQEDISKAPANMRKQMAKSQFNAQFIAKLEALQME